MQSFKSFLLEELSANAVDSYVDQFHKKLANHFANDKDQELSTAASAYLKDSSEENTHRYKSVLGDKIRHLDTVFNSSNVGSKYVEPTLRLYGKQDPVDMENHFEDLGSRVAAQWKHYAQIPKGMLRKNGHVDLNNPVHFGTFNDLSNTLNTPEYEKYMPGNSGESRVEGLPIVQHIPGERGVTVYASNTREHAIAGAWPRTEPGGETYAGSNNKLKAKWCTAYDDAGSMYSTYAAKGKLFQFHPNSPIRPGENYQLYLGYKKGNPHPFTHSYRNSAFHEEEFKNEKDREEDIDHIARNRFAGIDLQKLSDITEDEYNKKRGGYTTAINNNLSTTIQPLLLGKISKHDTEGSFNPGKGMYAPTDYNETAKKSVDHGRFLNGIRNMSTDPITGEVNNNLVSTVMTHVINKAVEAPGAWRTMHHTFLPQIARHISSGEEMEKMIDEKDVSHAAHEILNRSLPGGLYGSTRSKISDEHFKKVLNAAIPNDRGKIVNQVFLSGNKEHIKYLLDNESYHQHVSPSSFLSLDKNPNLHEASLNELYSHPGMQKILASASVDDRHLFAKYSNYAAQYYADNPYHYFDKTNDSYDHHSLQRVVDAANNDPHKLGNIVNTLFTQSHPVYLGHALAHTDVDHNSSRWKRVPSVVESLMDKHPLMKQLATIHIANAMINNRVSFKKSVYRTNKETGQRERTNRTTWDSGNYELPDYIHDIMIRNFNKRTNKS